MFVCKLLIGRGLFPASVSVRVLFLGHAEIHVIY